MADKLIKIVEDYFTALRDVRRLGAGTPERSYYSALDNLLDAIGADLKGQVLCLPDLGNTGAGHPDFGLYAKSQLQRGEPRKGQMPERGVIEMKPVADDAWLTAQAKQVTGYFEAYRLVIVTNLRDFLIIGEGPNGRAEKRESFRLAKDAASFWELVSTPRKSAERVGRAFGEYLKRALTQSVALREPKDLAWFLASYARDALERVEARSELSGLGSIKAALEEALGMTFEGDKGEHFFRSTLVQTLFYGVFSSWVLWAQQMSTTTTGRFEWQKAIWHLNVPFVSALFQQLAAPKQLKPLGLVELLDWTEATLNRVVKEDFLAKFNDADAVQFFYEPFLEAFDPLLRKQLGVWYTPSEIVTYMVTRVDKALKDDLGVEDGLAAENVYVLDPCCGTGAYVTAVLRRIDRTLDEKGLGNLKGQMVKKAALARVLGFEIMPAPFIVAHLRVGSELQRLGASLKDPERASVFLTNALTGWEPQTKKPLPFPEFEEERKKADQVKQDAPILVILGNPPYNGYAGVTIGEERDLSNAYRSTKRVRRPEGSGLNDLYVRFFRMAERRIVEKTGRGIVCFISNYSWLAGSSFTGMRERYLDVFNNIFIDNLHGDRIISERAPDGRSSATIFAIRGQSPGIKVGTSVALMVRKADNRSPATMLYRDFDAADADERRQSMLDTLSGATLREGYSQLTPIERLGLPFGLGKTGSDYFSWPKLSDLMPASFSGITTSRDDFLVSIDREVLKRRLSDYFSPKVSHEEMRIKCSLVMTSSSRFDPIATRETLIKRGLLADNIVRIAYRPYDLRWLYWDPDTKLLDEKRADYWEARVPRSLEMVIPRGQRKEWSPPLVIRSVLDRNAMDGSAGAIPFRVHGKTNVSTVFSSSRCDSFAQNGEEIFAHCVAVLHSPAYFAENGGAMRIEEPRVPLPGDADTLLASTALGATLATLLDPETPAPGVSSGTLRSGLKSLALPTRRDGKSLGDDDLKVSARWGYTQNSGGGPIVMPGPGLAAARAYTDAERAALALEGNILGLSLDEVLALLGDKTFDIHLNANAYWSNVPARVWDYTLGGYQVIKKWLSYRENAVLGRSLNPDEVIYVSEMVRRIAAILLLGPALDANYADCKAAGVAWKDGAPAA